MKQMKRIIGIALTVTMLLNAIPCAVMASGHHHGQKTTCGQHEHGRNGEACRCDECVRTSGTAGNTAGGADAAENLLTALMELPCVEELEKMPLGIQNQWYLRTQEVYADYQALSDGEKSVLSGAEAIFDSLFGYFNSLTMPAGTAGNAGHGYCGNCSLDTCEPGTALHACVWNIIRHGYSNICAEYQG